MARSLGTLVVDLLLKAGAFESDTKRAAKAAEKMGKQIEGAAKKAGAVLGTALVAGATAAGIALKQAIDRADEMHNAAQKIGITTETLSALQYAAEQAGVGFDALQGSLAKMVKFQVAAATGTKEAIRTFDAFGIALKDSNGQLKDSNALLRDWAGVFAQLRDGPEKTALALRVFGKSGADLIPLLNEGADGLQRMTDRAADLGLVIGSETARAADEFNDQLGDVWASTRGLANAVAADLLPDLNALASSFLENHIEGGKVSSTAKEIADGFRLARDTVVALVSGLGYLVNKYEQLAYWMGEVQRSSLPGRILGLDASLPRVLKEEAERDAAEHGQRFGDAVSGNLGRDASAPNIRGSGRSRGARGNFRGFDNNRFQGAADRLFGSAAPEAAKKAKDAMSEAEKAAKQLEEQYRRLLASQLESIALFGKEGEAAKIRYEIEHGELKALTDDKKKELLQNAERIDTMREEAKVKEELARIDKERREALKDLFSDLEFELDLLGKSNAERVAENELRRIGIDLATREGQLINEQVMDRVDALENAKKQIDALDEFRSNFADNVTDVLTGTKSIKDAFKSLADSVIQQIARMIAQRWTEQLFGQQGTMGGGGFLGFLGGLFGFGSGKSASPIDFIPGLGGIPGFANGTEYAPGGMAWVGERGPERVYLPRGSQVVPNHRLGASTNHWNINGPMTRQTKHQIEMAAYRGQRRALRSV